MCFLNSLAPFKGFAFFQDSQVRLGIMDFLPFSFEAAGAPKTSSSKGGGEDQWRRSLWRSRGASLKIGLK